MRVGLGYDVHPFEGHRSSVSGPLVLGGVVLDGPGLVGHSDGDVISHAVADALLGPVGLPDLGTMFPASDERFRDADSLQLLREVVRKTAEAGWKVGNVDVVVAAEIPVLAPYLDAMCANLSEALGGVHVSIAPKRGEGIGAIGRSEGIAAWAVALLEQE